MNLFYYVMIVAGLCLFRVYTKVGNPILTIYLIGALVIVMFFVFLFKGYLFSNKYTIQPSESLTKKEKDFIEKHKLFFEIVTRLFCFFLVIGGIIRFVIPCIMDLPAVIKNEYNISTGVIVGKVEESGDRKIIRLKDSETGNIISIVVNCKEINIGQEYTIKYLPHILRGEVVTK